jgi:phage baseplate assembly protein W
VPVRRISQGFKDISATFQINPLNNDLIAIRNANAISRSVRNLVFTIPGEKPFQPDIGSNVSRLLFENMDELTADSIKGEIENTINAYEPRVELNEVNVNPMYDDNAFDVTIRYYIIGIDVPEQQLEFVLQLTR